MMTVAVSSSSGSSCPLHPQPASLPALPIIGTPPVPVSPPVRWLVRSAAGPLRRVPSPCNRRWSECFLRRPGTHRAAAWGNHTGSRRHHRLHRGIGHQVAVLMHRVQEPLSVSSATELKSLPPPARPQAWPGRPPRWSRNASGSPARSTPGINAAPAVASIEEERRREIVLAVLRVLPGLRAARRRATKAVYPSVDGRGSARASRTSRDRDAVRILRHVDLVVRRRRQRAVQRGRNLSPEGRLARFALPIASERSAFRGDGGGWQILNARMQ